MRKNIKGIITRLAASIAFIGMIGTTNVYAKNYEKVIDLPTNQKEVQMDPCERSGKYNYCTAKCYNVYDKNDVTKNFRYIRVKVYGKNNNGNLANITKDTEVTLEKGKSPTQIVIKEGWLNSKNIVFAFYGNNPAYAARADVMYNPK